MIEEKEKELKGVDKILWYLLGPLKFFVVGLIFLLCLVFGFLFFQFLQNYILFELALVLSFVVFFSLAIGLTILLNRKRVVERITEDIFWYAYFFLNNHLFFTPIPHSLSTGEKVKFTCILVFKSLTLHFLLVNSCPLPDGSIKITKKRKKEK